MGGLKVHQKMVVVHGSHCAPTPLLIVILTLEDKWKFPFHLYSRGGNNLLLWQLCLEISCVSF
jgi:hypothetical protein